MFIAFIFALYLSLSAEKIDKPNIIYILADDLGIGDLGCYGQKVIQTPRLDAMAAGGLKFTQHYSGSTVCGPSRSTLLMGQHTGNIYLRGNGQLQVRPNPHDMIFPTALKRAGYSTAMIGKSGLLVIVMMVLCQMLKVLMISLDSLLILKRTGITRLIFGIMAKKLTCQTIRFMRVINTVVILS